jgi:type I restriction enzyme, S subunit
MSEWQARTIGEVCTKVVSGGTPLTSKTEYYQNGAIPWLKTKEINQRRIYSTENFITELGVKNSSAKIVPINTVTVAMYGDGQTAGRVGLIKTPMTTNQACCNLIINEDLADPEFVFYLLRGSYEELVAKKTGSGQQNLSAQLIKSFEFSAPPVIEQKAIANILSSLDNKIDLLHRENRTLEAMAEILFRQWFVEEATGEWKEYRLADFAEHSKESVTPSKTAAKIFHHFSLPAFDLNRRPTIETGNSILSNKYRVKSWSILVSKLNPRFPRIWAIGEKVDADAICSTEFQVFIPSETDLYSYLYFLLRSDDAKDGLAMAASGTSGSHQRVRPEDILNIRTSLPAIDLARKYASIVMPNIKKIWSNADQIYSLEKIRDNLLPKLMSAEAKVII